MRATKTRQNANYIQQVYNLHFANNLLLVSTEIHNTRTRTYSTGCCESLGLISLENQQTTYIYKLQKKQQITF